MNIVTDIATRAHNHNWDMDPIHRSFLDQDFYKLLMAQLIWKMHPKVNATFGLINRTKSVRLAETIDIEALRDQLDYARTVRLTRGEATWLRGNTFYGKSQMFDPEFITWLENFRLPEYEIRRTDDGQFELTFSGPWLETTWWEIPALTIINEMRSREAIKRMSRFEIDVLYSRAKSKLWAKAQRLQQLKKQMPLRISDFGTRRRHSFLWQRWAIQALIEAIGDNFTGTSNAKMATDNDLEAIGTNAHELPMVYGALADTDEELKEARYRVLYDWANLYEGNLLVFLPDAFGTTSFLNDAGRWLANWRGIRPDSKPAAEGTQEALDWWRHHGVDPLTKLVVLSDGMDIDSIESAMLQFGHQTNIAVGWGTNLTNDFGGCSPDNNDTDLKAISLVCKVQSANGRPAVKLSDNPTKATGPKDEIARYLRVFGTAGMIEAPTLV